MRDFSVLDDLVEGVQIIDAEMRYVYLNRSLLAQIGMKLQEVVGQRMVDKFPGIDQTEVFREIIRCRREKAHSRVVNEFVFSDGRRTFFELSVQPLDEGVIVFSRDITETKKGEILLRESNKNLDHFAHIAAHDLREPARRAHLLAEEMLLDYGASLSSDARLVCEGILTQTERLLRFVNDFRKLSGLGGAPIARESFPIVDLARKVHSVVAAEAPDAHRTMHWPKTDSIVLAYPSLVELLLRNLFSNALSYGKGETKFSFSSQDEGLVFTLQNGIAEAPPQGDLFLPFVTGDRTHRTGLGLAIVRKIVDYHGGGVWSEASDEFFRVHFTLAPQGMTLTPKGVDPKRHGSQ